MRIKLKTLYAILITSSIISFSFIALQTEKENDNQVLSNNFSDYISINECWMWIANNGMCAHDPRTDGSGFYWPGGDSAVITAVFADGLVWGAKVEAETRVGGATYRYGLQAGKILPDGTADDPNLDKYRIYKARKNFSTISNPELKERILRDMREWPVEDGAPWIDVNNDGIYNFAEGDTPEFIGDEVLWFVSNDMDAARTTYLYGTLPLGLEVQSTIFAFQQAGYLGDMIFKKYLLINKGIKTLKDMYLGQWSDTDLGFANDDFTGCDTTLNLGYTYNGDNNDEGYYGMNPPALGYKLLQGPIIPYDPNNPIISQYNLPDSAKFNGKWHKEFANIPMTTFVFYIGGAGDFYTDPVLGNAAGAEQTYNYMTGYLKNGDPFIDPTTGREVKKILYGDPVTGTGWYEGPGWPGGPAPDDRRHLQSSGPFTMAPGDTQEIAFAIMIARGNNNYNSITELKTASLLAQDNFDSTILVGVEKEKSFSKINFNLSQNYPNPFNPTTSIQYQVSGIGHVKLTVYDILGREVATLVNEEKKPGTYKVEFDGRGSASSVYFCRMEAFTFSKTIKLILLK